MQLRGVKTWAFQNGKLETESTLHYLLKNEIDYKALPAKISNNIVNLVVKSFKSYFLALKSYNKSLQILQVNLN